MCFPEETKDKDGEGQSFSGFCSARDKAQGKLDPVPVPLNSLV